MSLQSGTRLGPYEILGAIGAGGMGEVYRARDSRLDRDVAIKVLPASFAADEERLGRFEQEARATSALNHPNILTVYDIGSHEGTPYLVAELLEGEELRAALHEGALPVRKALDYARQITQGLAAAHDKGIVHRDLKPDNLFITSAGHVKILDFGLAKLRLQPHDVAGAEAATRKALTDPGVVMGTAGYMAPEQVRGREADHRADIFSFGVILHEMLSGRRTFTGDSSIEVMNAILKEEPPELSETNAKISPQLERVVRRCLEKKPEARFHSAHDLGFALDALSTPSDSSGSRALAADNDSKATSRNGGGLARTPWIVAGVLAVAWLATIGAYFGRSALPTRTARLSFTAPENLSFNDGQADRVIVSPDGQKLAFTARAADGKRQIWVRSLDSLDAQPLPGTDDPLEPFWSPDSRSLGFGSQGKLQRVDLAGGRAQILCDAARLVGGTWSSAGVIVFGPDFGAALSQVPATGGEPRAATLMNAERGDYQHGSPSFLPDGRRFLFRINTTSNPRGVWVGSLDSPDVKQVLTDNTDAAYAPPGWLIFFRNGLLVAQPFDAATLDLSGEAAPITTRPARDGNAGLFSVSNNGVLLWQSAWAREYQLTWFDRDGRPAGTVGAPAQVTTAQGPRLSPDGTRLVIQRDQNIWVIDLVRETAIRLTSTFSQLPVWSPDGKYIAYSARGIFRRPASGVGGEEVLLEGVNFPYDWSSDGRFLIFTQRGEKTRLNFWVLPLFGDRMPYPLLNTPFEELGPQLSPDGRWLAYASDESGSFEVYVQPFTADGKLGSDKRMISTSGGVQARWRRDGQELFYVATSGQMMAVSMKTSGAAFEPGAPRGLFKTRMLTGYIGHDYTVTPDGRRFLIGTLVDRPNSATSSAVVVLNWPEELKSRAGKP